MSNDHTSIRGAGRRRRATGLALAFLVAGVLAACNTTRGVGEDVEAVGRGISDAAEEAQE
ncbi:MAG: entericidin A/B family lipoprotein [Pseudomonadota bacterium]